MAGLQELKFLLEAVFRGGHFARPLRGKSRHLNDVRLSERDSVRGS